jgi:hypothetical protein
MERRDCMRGKWTMSEGPMALVSWITTAESAMEVNGSMASNKEMEYSLLPMECDTKESAKMASTMGKE